MTKSKLNYKEEDIINDYNYALQLDSKFSSVYFNKGLYYESIGKYEETLNNYSKLIEIDTELYFKKGYINKALILLKLKRYEEGFSAVKEAYNAASKMSIIKERNEILKDLNEYIKKLLNENINEAKEFYNSTENIDNFLNNND
ncbi:hypothetical protein [uncultured Brachyspira sp.]|uniref:hypothetical protein n=1 Tax=uncultured Brachyspira sp. TaxID=221953 RepID=UPI002605166F|nr:hypothetical protein [uncultured Brachyspira sp.]